MLMICIRITTVLALSLVSLHLNGAVMLPERLDRNIDIGKELEGEWLFSPRDTREHLEGRLDPAEWRTVTRFPHNWRDRGQSPHSRSRIAWYRLSIHVPDHFSCRSSILLRVGPVNDSDETYFNGTLIGKTGEISPEPPAYHGYDAIRLYYVPETLIRKGEENLLLIRVQSFFPGEGGFRDPESTVIIGPDTHIRKNYFSSELVIFLFSVLLFLVSFLFFYRFVIYKKRENLFLFLSDISAAIYFFIQSQMKFYISTDYHLFKRLEYGLVLYITVFLMDFIIFYLPGPESERGSATKRLALLLNLLPLPFVLFILFSKNILLWDHYFNLVSIPLWSVPLLLSFTLIIQEIRNKSVNAFVLLLALTVCTAAFVNDILSDRGIVTWGQVSHVTMVIFNLSVIYLEIVKPAVPRPGRRDISETTVEKVRKAKEFLHNNFTDEISREGLASSLDISPDHLSRYFKRLTGVKIGEYVNRLRIEKAAEMLTGTDRKIIDIAHACGFESLRSFNRIFRDRHHCSPGEYRKNNRGN